MYNGRGCRFKNVHSNSLRKTKIVENAKARKPGNQEGFIPGLVSLGYENLRVRVREK
jgi:hypothetical protein